jgi:catechol 2,3-dioxygenase-like lactoylglutathione lyase family enzyme
MIIGIDHVQITVPRGQEPAAREFYCGVLGLTEIEKPDALKPRGGFWLAAGDRELHVGTEDGVDRQATKAHVALAVDDLFLWRKRLSERGIAVEDGVPIPGCERFEFRDPFGNRVEMIQRLSRNNDPAG